MLKRVRNSNRKRKRSLQSCDDQFLFEFPKRIKVKTNARNTKNKKGENSSFKDEAIPKNEVQRSDPEYSLASKVRLVVDDDDCLDYEPYEDEVLSTANSSNHEENCSNFIDHLEDKTQDNVHMYELKTNISQNDSIERETYSCKENTNIETNKDLENYEIETENFKMNNQTVIFNKMDADNEQIVEENIMRNAKIDFKGLFNLTVTRNLLNTVDNVNCSKNSENTPSPDYSLFPSPKKSSNVKILDISTVNGEELQIEHKRSRRKLFHADIEHCEETDSLILPVEEELKSDYSRAKNTVSKNDKSLKNNKEELITKWLMHSEEKSFIEFMSKLCESHFSSGCNNAGCMKTHSLEVINERIREANLNEFDRMYTIVLTKQVWFTALFDTFLSCFLTIPRFGELMLVNMIEDVYKTFSNTLTDKTTYISKIIETLMKMGFSFKQVIEKILSKYGTSELWICDVMLFIIAEEPNLSEHWYLVQKIIDSREHIIDHDVVMKFLMAPFCDYPPNRDLCQNIYYDILQKNVVDFSKIDRRVCERIEKMFVKNPDNNEPTFDLSERLNYEQGVPDEEHTESKKITRDNDTFNNGNITLEMNIEEYIPEMTTKKFDGEPKKNMTISTDPSSSKNIVEMIKLVTSTNVTPKPLPPANIIAHPSCQPKIDPNYHCNLSLHNLIPDVYNGMVDISKEDVRKLFTSLRESDAALFLEVLESNSDRYTIENFVISVLAMLNSNSSTPAICTTFVSLLNALEKNNINYMLDIYTKVSIEIVALNLIYLLDSKRQWHMCKKILLKMKDWHSLVTSKLYLQNHMAKSHMERYIFLVKVLLSAGNFCWPNEILQVKVLNLLGHPSTWPFEYEPSDVEARNQVLKTFFDQCFFEDIVIANDLLKNIVVMHNGEIDGFEFWTWFNSILIKLIEEDKTRMLLFLHNDISKYYERHMNKYVLQAFMLHMQDAIEEEEAFRLFELCCDKGVYHKYTGEELVVNIQTNLTNFEIESLLHCYLKNFKNKLALPHDFRIDLSLAEYVPQEFETIKNYRMNRNVHNVFEKICNILNSKYDITINQPLRSKIYISKTMLCKSIYSSYWN